MGRPCTCRALCPFLYRESQLHSLQDFPSRNELYLPSAVSVDFPSLWQNTWCVSFERKGLADLWFWRVQPMVACLGFFEPIWARLHSGSVGDNGGCLPHGSWETGREGGPGSQYAPQGHALDDLTSPWGSISLPTHLLIAPSAGHQAFNTGTSLRGLWDPVPQDWLIASSQEVPSEKQCGPFVSIAGRSSACLLPWWAWERSGGPQSKSVTRVVQVQ